MWYATGRQAGRQEEGRNEEKGLEKSGKGISLLKRKYEKRKKNKKEI